MLRVACDGEATGASITVNGQPKGDCPIDVQVAAGAVKVEAVKVLGQGKLRTYTTQFTIGSGVAKRIEVELGSVQLTAEGQRLEDERLRRQRAETEAREAEQRRITTSKKAAATAATDKLVDEVLAGERARATASIPDCPDCPTPLPGQAAAHVKTELPDTGDPTSRQLARNALDALQPFLSDPAAFRPEGTVIAVPCQSAERQMRQLAGMLGLDELTAAEQAVFSTGTPDLSAHYYYRDVKIWPTRAVCRNGLLEGEVDFWIFGTRVMSAGENIFVEPKLMRVMSTLAGGKPTELTVRLSHSRFGLTWFKDENLRKALANRPRTAGVMRSEFRTDSPSAEGSGVSVTHTFHTDPDIQKLDQGLSIFVSRPLGAGRTEAHSWMGTRKVSLMQLKSGVPHGAFTTYGYRMATGYVVQTTTHCYRNGVLVQVNPCKVD